MKGDARTAPTALTLLVLLGVALSGCSDAAPPVDGDDFQIDKDLRADDDTGIIRGVVVDAAIVPVPGVTVTVQGADQSTTTDAEGRFGIDALPPGTYFLGLEKPGWQPVQQGVEVVAGVDKPPIVKVQMVRDPSSSPYVQARSFEGFITCSFSLVAAGVAACGLEVPIVGIKVSEDDVFDVVYTPADLGGTPDWAQSEMSWESSQLAGDRMGLQYSLDLPNQTLYYNYASAEGLSPQTIAADKATMADLSVGVGEDLHIRVFNAPVEETDPGCVPRPQLGGCTTGLGATIDQAYTVFTHTFYNLVPSEGWTFIGDGPYPVPTP